MMKIRKLAAALAVISFMTSMVLSAVVYAAGSEPAFFVKNSSVDIGEFYEGVDIMYDFTVRNNGAGELHILNVKPG